MADIVQNATSQPVMFLINTTLVSRRCAPFVPFSACAVNDPPTVCAAGRTSVNVPETRAGPSLCVCGCRGLLAYAACSSSEGF